MYFKNIGVRNFRAIAELNLHLDPGLNILFGRNETGKSTFLQALHAALFEKADSTKADVLGYKSWQTEADPTVQVVFVADGVDYQVEKQFLGAKKGRLSCKASGLDTTNKDRIDDELAKLIPLFTPDGRSVKNTFWIRQRELEDTIFALKNDADVRTAVQSVVFKSDGDIEAIKSAVASKVAEIAKGWQRPAKHLGPLAQSLKEHERLQNEVTELKNQVASIENDVKKQRELTERLTILEAQIKEDEGILAAVERYSQAKKDLDEANKRLDEIQEAIDTNQENAQQTISLNERITLVKSKHEECKNTIVAIQRAQKRAEAEAKLKAERALLSSAQRLQKQISKRRTQRTKLSEISKDILATARKLARDIEVKSESLKAAQLSVELKALSDIKLAVSEDGSEQRDESLKAKRRKTYRANQEVHLTIPEVIELKLTSGVSDAAELQKQLTKSKKRLLSHLAKYGARSVQKLAEKYEERQQLASTLAKLETELKARLNSRSRKAVQESVDSLTKQIRSLTADKPRYILKPGETLNAWNQKKDKLVRDLANLSANLRQRETEAKKFLHLYGSIDKAKQRRVVVTREARKAEVALADTPKMELPDDQIFTRKKRLEKNSREYAIARDELLRLSGALQKSTGSSDQVRLKEAELAEARFRYEANLVEFEAYKVLGETLAEAEFEVSKHFMQPLEHIVTTILPRLTSGRYSELSLNESLEIDHVKYGNLEIDPRDLSTGAQGQLALALRLALIEHLAGNERQLVVIDDALVNFDAERLSEAKKLLSEFANKHQVIYLTCHDEMSRVDGATIHKLE